MAKTTKVVVVKLDTNMYVFHIEGTDEQVGEIMSRDEVVERVLHMKFQAKAEQLVVAADEKLTMALAPKKP